MRLPGSIFVAARRARRAVDFPRCRSTWSRKPSAPFCVLQTASVSQLWPRRSPSGRGFFFFSARRRRFRRPPIDLIPRPLHQLRQLRHVDRDPAGFVAREKIGSGASARFILIIDVTERSPVGIADNEARGVDFFDRPLGERSSDRACFKDSDRYARRCSPVSDYQSPRWCRDAE